ncbi:MAG: hypothetical protein WCO54_05560 [Bacteroidota bacterium]
MKILEQTQEKPLECPVTHKSRNRITIWMKRIGVLGFFFFLIKGLIWLALFYFGFDIVKSIF